MITNGNRYYQCLPMVTNVLSLVTDAYPMVTDVYPMVAKESSVANPQKVAKIDENIRKVQKRWIGNTVFAKELPDSSVLLVVIDAIGSHRCHRLINRYYRWHRCDTQYIAGHWRQNQHLLPEDIGNQQKDQNRVVSSLASVGHRVSQAQKLCNDHQFWH